MDRAGGFVAEDHGAGQDELADSAGGVVVDLANIRIGAAAGEGA